MFECSFCTTEFSNKSALANHRKYCVKNPDNDGKCVNCGNYVSKLANEYCSVACANHARTQSEKTKKKIKNSLREYHGTNRKSSDCVVCAESVPGPNDKFCSRECYAKDRSESDRDEKTYMRRYMKERYHKRRNTAIKELGGECVVCGTTDNLQIDHINPKDKEISLSKMWSVAKEKYNEELKKCQLLCETCHKEKTASEPISGRYGEWECSCGEEFTDQMRYMGHKRWCG